MQLFLSGRPRASPYCISLVIQSPYPRHGLTKKKAKRPRSNLDLFSDITKMWCHENVVSRKCGVTKMWRRGPRFRCAKSRRADTSSARGISDWPLGRRSDLARPIRAGITNLILAMQENVFAQLQPGCRSGDCGPRL